MKKSILVALAAIAVATTTAQETNYDLRYATNPVDFKSYDTERLRDEYLIQDLFVNNETNMVYTMHDRMLVGGVKPVDKALKLETIDPLKAEYFLERREIGIINVGGEGTIYVDGKSYKIGYKEALYIGRGAKEVIFESAKSDNPALFYFNSCTAHASYPTKFITKKSANAVLRLGSMEESNAREVIQYIVSGNVKTCQLQMGMTELKSGSVWNTMPTHVHNRRMEVYMYFELPENQSICHFVGEPQETRAIWMHNLEATISPEWSIHGAAGTSNYTFIWGMAGENLDYSDMEKVAAKDLQ
ncbi:MAG: 5-dehydro-4-deoxy-D-glucuronate isomerase [Rikenellaceae bacterium]